MRKLLTAFLIIITSVATNAQVDRTHPPQSDAPEKLNVGELIPVKMDNGMQVFLAPVKKYPKFTITVNIEQPSIYEDERIEEKEILGKAYMEKLSKHYPAGEIDSLVRLKGAMLSVTNHGGTIKGMNRDIDLLLDMYSDLLLNPIIKEEYISEEAEEFEKSNKNGGQPTSVYGDEFSTEQLIDSLLTGKVEKEAEKKEIVRNYDQINIETIRDYLQKRIVANNAVVVLVGDFSREECKKMMDRHFGSWQQGEAFTRERKLEYSKPIIRNRQIYVIDDPHAVQSKIRFNWHLEDAFAYSENSIKLEVLNEIFGESQSSYLYRNLREDKGLCYGIRSSIAGNDAGGSGSLWTHVRTDQTAYAMENIILEMLRIRNTDVTQKDLDIAKSSLIGEFTRSLSGIAPVPYMSFAMVKDKYDLPDDYLQTKVSRYYSVTREDIREMARKYIEPFKCVILVTGKARELRGTLDGFGDVTYLDEDGNELTFDK
jgi:predicted Zn-dependent peptidase